jgi:hypothetical protein
MCSWGPAGCFPGARKAVANSALLRSQIQTEGLRTAADWDYYCQTLLWLRRFGFVYNIGPHLSEQQVSVGRCAAVEQVICMQFSGIRF